MPAAKTAPPDQKKPDARTRLLDAALTVVRSKGFAATSVDELCAHAGVTKGAFFHHFKTKTAIGVAAAAHWSEMTGALFATAPYHTAATPLERVIGYLEFRKRLLAGDLPDFTCLVGTMVQEVYLSAPDVRDACNQSITGHAATLQGDIAAAMQTHQIKADWTPQSLALHTQAVLQGAFILAKATGGANAGAAIAADSVDHLIRYVRLLFAQPA